jgi:hypothetical protein
MESMIVFIHSIGLDTYLHHNIMSLHFQPKLVVI